MLRKYVLPLLLMIGLLVGWQFTLPRYPANFYEPVVEGPKLPNGGVPPWNANEPIFQEGRDRARASALRGLDQAWSTFCNSEGRKKLVSAVSYYFEQRGNQENSYPARWGKEGRDYIVREWSTSDDRRIERLVQDLYRRGYLRLADLRPFIANRVMPLLKDTHVIDAPCKS
ncbi:MAG: hypothetical protein WBD48_00615 [Pseudolabrys sp.]